MNPVRLLGAGTLAIATTFGLIFTMHQLIAANMSAPEDKEQFKVADVVMPEQKIETQYDTTKPVKPEEPETPPPEMPEPEFEDPNLDTSISVAAPRAGGGVKLSGFSFGEGDYLPIVKVQPQYPRRALQRGLEGYVIVEYTVTTNGSVRDPIVIEAFTLKGKPTTVFNRAALKSALKYKYKYKPRVVDGKPTEVPNVRTKISFNMAKN